MRLILSLLLVSVLAIGLACQNPTNQTANKTSNQTANEVKKTTSTPADATPRITLAEAKKDFDAGNAVFIDTRVDYQFRQEHIKGAINIPAEAVEAKYKEIPTGKKIIAYCS